MTKKERFKNVIDWFLKNKPIAETELHYKNPYQLLIAVILSAQCTCQYYNTGFVRGFSCARGDGKLLSGGCL